MIWTAVASVARTDVERRYMMIDVLGYSRVAELCQEEFNVQSRKLK